MHAGNRATIYSAGSGDWTQARLITVSDSACTVPMSHGDKKPCAQVNSISYCYWDGKWVVAYRQRGEGLVRLIGVAVCVRAALRV